MAIGIFPQASRNRVAFEEPAEDDDAEFLLPNNTGRSHRRIQKVKHSVSYLFISAAAAFTLVMTIWLGPGLVRRDPHGLSSQLHAHVGYPGEQNASAPSPAAVIPVSSPNTPRPKVSVTKLAPERRPLPHHSWNPLLYDPAPITHVYVKPCMFPPWAFPTFCTPTQTAREIALYGKWVRVPRDLSKGVGHYYTEIYYRRAQSLETSALDVQPVTGLRVLDDAEAARPEVLADLEKHGWELAGEDLHSGIWPAKVPHAKLWLTRSPTFNGTGLVKPINEINVLWGNVSDVAPWWGFERITGPSVFENVKKLSNVRCDIIVRREIVEPPPAPELVFQPHGKFKILQIADLHFSASGGKCNSASLLPSCETTGADASTAAWLSDTIDEVKPDLIVLTGDQLRGNGETFDTMSTITKIGHLFGDKRVPWTVVFGNHDSDKSLAIEEQMYVYKHMPYFVGKAGPGVPGFSEEHEMAGNKLSDMGVGNYVLRVNASKTDATQALTLYFLDSHDYPPMTVSQLWSIAMGSPIEYDWLKNSQISWYKNQSDHQPTLLRPYRPASEHLPQAANHTSQFRKPAALMFFHIPLPEAYGTADTNPKTGGELVFGNQREGVLAARKGAGFFKKAILSTTDGTSETEVKVIANGHAHMTDTCRRHEGVWNCFAGLSSYSGKAHETWERRVRVFEVEEYGERIKTYQIKDKRALAAGEKPRFGETVLYDGLA